MSIWTEQLRQRQGDDGGWSYHRTGSSWTEPTCFALLALCGEGADLSDASVRAGADWLASRQRSDGGFAPASSVAASTWVTALALLLPAERLASVDRKAALDWLVSETGQESGFWYRLRLQLLGVEAGPGQQFEGWPWYPGAAAWVYPTALSLICLRRLSAVEADSIDNRVAGRIEDATAYLLSRRCRDGGWNHGSTQALGYDSNSYPETTGVALLALKGSRDPSLSGPLELAERYLRNTQSLEAASWLSLGLGAHGRSVGPVPETHHDGTQEIALAALAEAAREGRNVFFA